jgi:hypothetical protein
LTERASEGRGKGVEKRTERIKTLDLRDLHVRTKGEIDPRRSFSLGDAR